MYERAAAFHVVVGVIAASVGLRQVEATDYVFQLWTSDDDLPQNSVTCIEQTRDGYLGLGPSRATRATLSSNRESPPGRTSSRSPSRQPSYRRRSADCSTRYRTRCSAGGGKSPARRPKWAFTAP